jgi:hypothetical protein
VAQPRVLSALSRVARGGAEARRLGGEQPVRDALARTLEQFRLTDGGYRLENTVHCLIAVA